MSSPDDMAGTLLSDSGEGELSVVFGLHTVEKSFGHQNVTTHPRASEQPPDICSPPGHSSESERREHVLKLQNSCLNGQHFMCMIKPANSAAIFLLKYLK